MGQVSHGLDPWVEGGPGFGPWVYCQNWVLAHGISRLPGFRSVGLSSMDLGPLGLGFGPWVWMVGHIWPI
jgi:hypothetical protein